MSCDIIKVYVLIAPLKVMDDSLISELLLHNENVLEEVDNSLLDIKMVEFCDHGFLILQISLVYINQGIPFIYDITNIVKNSSIGANIHLSELVC